MTEYTVLTINPGSTSMKIGLFRNEENLFVSNMDISADVIKTFATLYDQYLYRKKLVISEVEKHGFHMNGISVFLARVGGMVPCDSGVYGVNDKLMDLNNIKEKNNLTAQMMGCQFVRDFSKEFGGEGYVINDSAVDEFSDVAHVTGLKGVWRGTYAHTLNQKAAGALAANAFGGKYESARLIVAHLGGGVSIGAHCNGRMIDSTNLFGEGPMSPTRTGALAVGDVLMQLMEQKSDIKGLYKKSLVNGGGLVGHLGTADGREVEKRIADGDEYAKLIYDGMIYQIGKSIVSMAASLEGRVDGIVLTGGMANSYYIQEGVEKYCKWIAPIYVFAGEYETEAMVNAALKVMRGEEPVKEYTGEPTFNSSKYQ
jgi:butyrate kinase